MKKANSLKWIVCLCAVAVFLAGCSTPYSNDPQSEIVAEKMKELAQADSQLEDLATTLAPVLLPDSKLLAILHDEIDKRFDGETEVLFEDFSKIAVEGAITVSDYIKEKLDALKDGRTVYGNQYADIDGILGYLDSLINLHIYMPRFELWDSSLPFVLAYIPLSKDGDTIEEVTAYDGNLNMYTINKTNITEYRLLILGPNERTDANNVLRSDMAVYEDGRLVTLSGSRSAGFTREGAREYIQTINIYSEHEGGIGQGSPEFILYYKYGNEGVQYDINYKDTFDRKIGQPVGVNADIGPWDEKIKGTFLFISMVEDDPSYGLKVTISAEAKEDISGIPVVGKASVAFEIGWGDDKLGNMVVDYRDEPRSYSSDANQYNCTMMYIERELCKPEHPGVLYAPEGEVTTAMPVFEWEDTPGAQEFNVYVYRKNDDMLVGQVFDWIAPSYVFPRAFKTGTSYYWMVEGKGRCGTGPMSGKMHFTVPATIPEYVTPEVPKNSITESMPTFKWSSTFSNGVYTLNICRTSNDSPVFQKTDIAGTSYKLTQALPANVSLYWTVSLAVMGCTNDTYVSAKQSFVTSSTSTPEPEPESTPAPITVTEGPTEEPTREPEPYTLLVTTVDSTGKSITTPYEGLHYGDKVSVCTVSSYIVGDIIHYQKTLIFNFWTASGNLVLSSEGSPCTDITVYGSGSVNPAYSDGIIITPPPTDPPAESTPDPAEEPTAGPTAAPPETFSLSVTSVESGGTGSSKTHTGLKNDSAVGISTSSGWSVVSPYKTINITFVKWHLSGGATIDAENSSSTTVRNFTSNASVSPEYKSE